MITFGSPPAIKFNVESQLLSIKISEPKDSLSLVDKITQQLQHVTIANVCLSGGIDSQFMLRIAKKLNIPIKAYTYLASWQGSPINTDDVILAKTIAEKENVELEIMDIDLYEFFSTNMHLQYAKEFSVNSPQIAVHLHFLKMFKDIPGTVFMGGEMPMLIKNSDNGSGPRDIAGIPQKFLMINSVAYRQVAEKFGIELIKDILLYTPEIIYKTLEVSIDLVEKLHIHSENVSDNPLISLYAHKIKYHIYEQIIPGGINPLTKNTGFEKLKKYQAMQSGIYNQFDINYRFPMFEEYISRFGSDQGLMKYKAGNIPNDLTDRYREAIAKYNSEGIHEYSFDF